MLILSAELYNKDLMAIRTGDKIGNIDSPIINPDNLHIDGFYCTNIRGDRLHLLDIHIRDFSSRGIIIDDPSDLSEKEELIRLQPVINIGFELIGKTVISGRKKLGKVIDFATEKESLYIQKLYVKPSVWSSINTPQLTIDRSSIIEISNSQIIISDPDETVKLGKNSSVMATD